MIQFTPNFIDELRSRIRPSSIISKYIVLKSNGREMTGLCPFHSEKTSSFTVSDMKGFYHCFGCGAHGDVITFLMKHDGLSYFDAVKQLALIAGLKLPEASKEYKQQREKYDSLQKIMLLAKDWYKNQLLAPAARDAREYLAKRGVSKDLQAEFGLGLAPDSWQGLYQYLTTKQVPLDKMQALGLISKNEQDKIYDKFRNRILFPISNSYGEVIAFGGRSMGDIMPKYLNSPDTELFKKGEILYNEHLAKIAAYKNSRLLVVEGYMDVIALYGAGIREVVAPLGTAITESQLQRMWNLAKEPIICLDGDKAGQRAALKIALLALSLLKPGYSLNFITLPAGLDPDEYIKAHGTAEFNKLLGKATGLSEILWTAELNAIGFTTPEKQALLEKSLLKLADTIKEPTIANYYRNFFRKKLRDLNYNQNYNRKNNNLSTGNLYVGTKKNAAFESKNINVRLTDIAATPAVALRSVAGASSLIMVILLKNPEILSDYSVLEDLVRLELDDRSDELRNAILEIFHQNSIISADSLQVGLENLGFRSDISSLAALNLYPDFALASKNIPRLQNYWKYALNMYNVAVLEDECRNYANSMTYESELKAGEIRKQIAELDEVLKSIEVEFAEEYSLN